LPVVKLHPYSNGLAPQIRGVVIGVSTILKVDCYDAILKFAYFQKRWELTIFKGFTGLYTIFRRV
jgi:hypothetical protein